MVLIWPMMSQRRFRFLNPIYEARSNFLEIAFFSPWSWYWLGWLQCQSTWIDSRGKRILEMATRTELVVLNAGFMPTFWCPDCKGNLHCKFRVVHRRVVGPRKLLGKQPSIYRVGNSWRYLSMCTSCALSVAKMNIGRFVEALSYWNR